MQHWLVRQRYKLEQFVRQQQLLQQWQQLVRGRLVLWWRWWLWRMKE
jgi:hypothetical protein